MLGAGVARYGTAGTVSRQVDQAGGAVKLAHPVRHLTLFASEPLALPVRKVRVLDGQIRKGRCFTAHKRAVQGSHFAHQYAHRPAVGDNMVKGNHNHMVAATEAHQPGAYQRTCGQVERDLCFVAYQLQCAFVAHRMRQVGQVGQRERKLACRGHQLDRLTIDHGEAGTQGLVAADDLIERPGKRRHIKLAGQPQGRWNVVKGVAGLKLIEEPQALLRVRQRQGLVSRYRHDARLRRRGQAHHTQRQCRHRRRFEQIA